MRRTKRLIAIVLSVLLITTMLPGLSQLAFAEEGSDPPVFTGLFPTGDDPPVFEGLFPLFPLFPAIEKSSEGLGITPLAEGDIYSESDLFNRLKLNTLDEPDGYDERSASNPYGSRAIQILTVNEMLYSANGSGTASLHGSGVAPGANLSLSRTHTHYGNWRNCNHIAATEGNFGGPDRGTQSGRKDAMAVLSVYKSSNNYVYEVWIQAGLGTGASSHVFLGRVASIPATSFPEHLLQQNLHIAAADLNGDGFDEIIVFAPSYENNNGLFLYVYSLNNTNSPASFLTNTNWTRSTIGITGFRMSEGTTASLAVGDLNRDGYEDIAYVVSRTDVSSNRYFNSASYDLSGRVIYGQAGFSLTAGNHTAETFIDKTYRGPVLPNQYDAGYLWQPGVAIADVDPGGSPGNELLLGYATISAGQGPFYIASRYQSVSVALSGWGVEMLSYDFSTRRMSAPSGPVMWKEASNYFGGAGYPLVTEYHSWGREQALMDSAAFCVAGGKIRPDGKPSIMMNGFMWTWDGTAFVPESSYNLTQESFLTTTYFSLRTANYTGSNPVFVEHYRSDRSSGFYAINPNTRRYANPYAEQSTDFMVVYASNHGWHPEYNQISLMNSPWTDSLAPKQYTSFRADRASYLALPDVDSDSAILVYQDHQIMYTDPIVVAALASPPYFSDLAAIDDSHTSSYTEFATSKGQGGANSISQTFNLGGYVSIGFGTGAGVFGESIKAAVEMEASYNHGWTWESEQRSMIEFEKGFDTSGGQDSVVLYAVPQDVYAYKLYLPMMQNGSVVYKEQNYAVVIPYDPCYSVLPLEQYNEVYADYPDLLPDVATEVFTHTLGVPGSYPTSSSGYTNPLTSSGLNNYTPGASGIRDSISVSNESSEGTVSTNQVGLKAGGGVEITGNFVDFKVMIGITLGYDDERGEASIDTAGVTYEGYVRGPSTSIDGANRYSFGWNLMQYQYQGTQNFPVITYTVRNASNPALLPGDYGVLNTTQDSVKLYWEPSPEDQLDGNIVYDVYRATNLGVGSVPVNNTYPYSYDPVAGVYTITQSGLNPQTEYWYVITASRYSNPASTSIYSDRIRAWTLPSGASIYFDPQPASISMPAATTLAATFNAAGFELFSYEWQKKSEIGSTWTRVSGSGYSQALSGNDFSLTFTSPSPDYVGTYRLFINYAQGVNSWSIASDPAVVSFSKIDTEVEFTGAPTFGLGNQMLVEAEVTKVGGMGPLLTGEVQFAVTDTATGATIYANSSVDPDGLASAYLTVGAVGTYTVVATYRGDVTYNGSVSLPITATKSRQAFFFMEFDPITGLSHGTAKTASALGLPNFAELVTDIDNVFVPVTWDVDSCSYNLLSTGAQTFTVYGTVSVDDIEAAGVSNASSIVTTVEISVTVDALETGTTSNALISITPPADITGIPNGTLATALALGLPATVGIITDEGAATANVSWNVEYSSYDPDAPFAQSFAVDGQVSLPPDVSNPADIPLLTSVKVAVGAALGAPTFTVTIVSAGTGPSGSGDYVPGQLVTIDAGMPPFDEFFSEWTTDDVDSDYFGDFWSSNTILIMPDNDVTVTAVFEPFPIITPVMSVTFTAVQTGGVSGTADSTGITLTFSEDVVGLTADDISITNGTGVATKGALSGSGTTWTIALSSVETEGNVTVEVSDFAPYEVDTEPQTVAVYKDTTVGSTDKVLMSVIAPTAITGLPNGTAATAAALGLPTTVLMTTDSGNVSAAVDWDVASSTYDAADTSAQTFTVSGTATLPAGVVNPDGVSLLVSINVTVDAAAATDKLLLSIITPAAITGLPNGTAATAAALGLPTTVTMVTDGGAVSALVTWDVASSSYDAGSTAGQAFTVSGTVALPSNVVNTNSVPLQVSVSIAVNAAVSSPTDKVLLLIIQPVDITGLPNGTAATAAALGLPATVLLATDDGNVSAAVSWDVASSTYDPGDTGAQTFTVAGTVTLPAGVVNPDGVPLLISINVSVDEAAAPDKLLSSIIVPPAITSLPNGTPATAAALGLPTTVTMITDGGVVSAQVDWDLASSTYDPSITTGQTFTVTGTVNLPAGVVNTDGVPLLVTISVTVNAAPLPPLPPDALLVSITAPAAITGLANGTAKTAAAFGLPATVTMVTDTGDVAAGVDWDVAASSYDPALTTAQTFSVSGTVTLPSGVVNTNGVPLTVNISVMVDAAGGVALPVKYTVNKHFGTWAGSGTALGSVEADHGSFLQLTYNGNVIDVADYTVTQGSTIITLSEAHLQTYANGTHILRAMFTDGYADLSLIVDVQGNTNTNLNNQQTGNTSNTNNPQAGSSPNTKSNSPATGDSANIIGLGIALLCAALGALLIGVGGRKLHLRTRKNR